MRLLLLNHYAGSPALGMEYRPYYLAREWVRLGHEVRILAANVSHVRTRQPQVNRETVDGIDYVWLQTPAYQGNSLGRMRNIMAYLNQTWSAAEALAQDFKPDAVIASSTYPMDNWVAQRITKAARALGCKTRHVYEVHDLRPLSLIELSGMSPWHPFALLCQSSEDAAYRNSDVVVSMLPKVHQHMASRGLDLRKLTLVPNGISPEEWTAPAEPLREDVKAALAAARAQGATIVGYAGSMELPNALDRLLDAAALLRDRPLHFVLIGDGRERERLQGRVNEARLSKLSLLPPIPKAQVPAFLAGIDVAYIGWQRVPMYRFGIAPNKLMDYMMAAKPVLHAVEAGNDPVGDAQCGLTVAPDNTAAIAGGLEQLAALKPRHRQAMGDRGKAFALKHHSYPALAQRFLRALEVPV